MASRCTAYATVLHLFLLPGILGLQWTGSLIDGENLHACAGSNVTIDWQYTTEPGDNVFSISWFFDGRSQEMVAMSSHGAFLPLPAFSQRVQQTTNAGVMIEQVTMAESGQYSVEINGQNSSGAFTVRRHVQLQVADHLLTTDRQLHVTQSPLAVHDDVKDAWHLELNCGTFAYAGNPPFQVQWLTPSGARLNSTGYHDNQFQFLVPNPVEQGSYVCEIPKQLSPLACLPSGQTTASEFTVDGVKARLTLMAANQQSLRQQNQMLRDQTQQLRAKQTTDETRIAWLEVAQTQLLQQLDANQLCCSQINTSLAALQSKLQQQDTANREDQASLTSQFQNWTSLIQAALIQQQSTPNVSFHAEMKTHLTRQRDPHTLRLVYNLDLSETRTQFDVNHGNGLHGRSPSFTAPVNGSYFLSASSQLETTNTTLSEQAFLPLQLVKSGEVLTEGLRECQAVVELSEGDVVHLQPVVHQWQASVLGSLLGSGTLHLLSRATFDMHFDGFLIRD